MASPPPPLNETQSLIPRYTSKLWRSFQLLLRPLSSFSDALLARIWSFLSGAPPAGTPLRLRLRRRKPNGLPLPLHSPTFASMPEMRETSGVICALDEIMDRVLMSLHKIHKNLQFWQARVEGTDARKVYFMVFERGPMAFIEESVQLIKRCRTDGYPMQGICLSAASSISEKISILTTLQCCLATFLAQVYTMVDKYGDLLAESPAKALPSLLVVIDSLFSKLEASMRNPRKSFQSDSSVFTAWNDSFALAFENLPEILHEREEWNHAEIMEATNLIYKNIQILDSKASAIVSNCQKPRKITLYWLQYTCGAVGLSICTGWLLRHSSLLGSPDIDNWISEAKESAAGFWNSRVEQPLISIRDELFETFRGRQKGVIEAEEVQLTADSLHRMLLAFTEQTKGQKFPENASDQDMLEIVMARYEKELMHPIQNLFSGELARAMLIQIQKLKLDLETAMLELDQILQANEINFAVLAALPAFFISVILLTLIRAWAVQDKGAEGRGRMAHLQRRLLVAEVEKKIMQLQTFLDEGLEEDSQCMFGQVLYCLDRLYKAVEKHANKAGEWQSLRQDIIDVGNPRIKMEHKLVLTSRMERVYECMLPLTRKH